MTVRPSAGEHFVWNNSDGGATALDVIYNSVLLTVNRCTGVATVIGEQNSGYRKLAALAFGPDETLDGLNYSFFKIDTQTGQTVQIGSGFGLRIGAAEFDPFTGALYRIELDLPGPQKLATIDIISGQAVTVGELRPGRQLDVHESRHHHRPRLHAHSGEFSGTTAGSMDPLRTKMTYIA